MAADWQEGKDGGRRADARKADALPAAAPPTEQEPQTEAEKEAALDRVFWMQMRQGAMMQIAAIERRFNITPREEKRNK